METELQYKKKSNYPWKGFAIFLGLYLFGLATYYPTLLDQAEVYIEILGASFGFTPNQFAALATIQPLLLGVVAIYGGHRYAHKSQLRSLINEKVDPLPDTEFNRKKYTLKESIPFIVGIAGGLALLDLGFTFIFQNNLPSPFQPMAIDFNLWQVLSNLFYTGLGQEMLIRWGAMTALVYVLSSKGKNLSQMNYIIAFVFTAVLYGFSQYGSVADLTPILWLRMLLLNIMDGILYGWLYYKFHFEAAALSHMLTKLFIILGTMLIFGISG